MKVTRVFKFGEDRQIKQIMFQGKHERYFVPTMETDNEISFGYYVDVFHPNPFEFWGKDQIYYTVSLGESKSSIDRAKTLQTNISKDPYSDTVYIAETRDERTADLLSKTVAIDYLCTILGLDKC